MIGIVVLFSAFFVRIYKTSPGYTTQEYAEAFYRNAKECRGLEIPLGSKAFIIFGPMTADMPGKSLCVGTLN